MAMDDKKDIRDLLIEEMKAVFESNDRRIRHALEVLDYAEAIAVRECPLGREDLWVDFDVVIASAILHDIGINEAERKYGSSAGIYQEKEGPVIAERILKKVGFPEEKIEHVLKIIANHHSAKDIDTKEFRVIWDADWIVNFNDFYEDLKPHEKAKKISEIFRTNSGEVLALNLYV